MKMKKTISGVIFGLIVSFIGVLTVNAKEFKAMDLMDVVNNSPYNQSTTYSDYIYQAVTSGDNLIIKIEKTDGSYSKDLEFVYNETNNTLKHTNSSMATGDVEAYQKIEALLQFYLLEIVDPNTVTDLFTKFYEKIPAGTTQIYTLDSFGYEILTFQDAETPTAEITIELSDKFYNAVVEYANKQEQEPTPEPQPEPEQPGEEVVEPGEENEDGTVTQPNTGIFDEYQWLLYLVGVGALTLIFLVNRKRIHKI